MANERTPPAESTSTVPDAQDMVCYRVNLVARLVGQAIAAELAPHSLSPGQLPTLLALYEHDGRTQTELARITSVEQPTMAHTLRRMERDGLITRVVDTQNRRRQLVYLTDSGRGTRDIVQSLRYRIDQMALKRLNNRQHEELRQLLAIVTETLQEHAASS